MMRVEDNEPLASRTQPRRISRWGSAVADVFADLRVGTLLHRLLAHRRRSSSTVASSISLVDLQRRRYDKIAEGAACSCRLGEQLPAGRGRHRAGRRPAHAHGHRRLQRVRGSHLPPSHPISRRCHDRRAVVVADR